MPLTGYLSQMDLHHSSLMNSLGEVALMKSADRSALVYWLSEEVLSKNAGISVGRQRLGVLQSGRLEA